MLAHRDKDVLDVIALVRDAWGTFDPVRFQRAVVDRDLEIPMRRGYLAVRGMADTGELATLWEQRTGERLAPEAVAEALTRLHTLFP